MADPKSALTVAAALAVVVALLVWPRRGWLWRAFDALRASERVRIEDTLRHLHDCEDASIPGTRQGLADALQLSCERTTALAGRLVEMGLVRADGLAYRLTAAGRREALVVVRAHRLWGRYASGDTEPRPPDARKMARVLDRTAAAEAATRVALPDFPVGRLVEIVDIAGQPEEVSAQLLAAGLHIGMRVRLIERSPLRTRLDADGEEVVLAPVVAGSVTAVAVPEPGAALPPRRLSSLAPGERARVAGLSPGCRGIERRRLLDLGLVSGTLVEAELRSAAGDPTAYRVRGALLALRRRQAELVHVEHADEGARR